MRKMPLLRLMFGLLIGFVIKSPAQQPIIAWNLESKDSPEYFEVSDITPGTGMKGTKGFWITKFNRSSKQEIMKVKLDIPDNSVMRYPVANSANFSWVNNNIIAVYDVKQKSFKKSYIRLINANTGELGENIPVFSDKINSVFSFHEVVMKTFYSPDGSKMAVLKDNISSGNDINAEVNVYETNTLKLISNRNLGQKYNGTKRVFDLTKCSIDNSGNMQLVFNLINEETKVTYKSYSASLPVGANELQKIEEVFEHALADGSSKTSHGRFYRSLKDFVNDKAIEGVRIKNGSYKYSMVKGHDFKLIDNNGNLKSENTKSLPSDLFTYKDVDYSDPYLIRIINKKPYIVLAAGKFSYYALYQDQRIQYYTEGWDSSRLRKFKANVLKKYLRQYGLLDEYKMSRPKRELKDNVNSWFNKNINHKIKFINKLNKKMSE